MNAHVHGALRMNRRRNAMGLSQIRDDKARQAPGSTLDGVRETPAFEKRFGFRRQAEYGRVVSKRSRQAQAADGVAVSYSRSGVDNKADGRLVS